MDDDIVALELEGWDALSGPRGADCAVRSSRGGLGGLPDPLAGLTGTVVREPPGRRRGVQFVTPAR